MALRRCKLPQLVTFVFVFGLGACAHQNDGSMLVRDGDEDKTCSERHAEYNSADQLSGQSIDARRRWLTKLMRQRDCRLPKQLDTEFNFHLTISG